MSATNAVPIEQSESDVLALETAMSGSAQIATFEAEALELAEQAQSIHITDQDNYEAAVECGNKCAGALKRWAQWIERPYEVVYGAYRNMLAVKKAVESPLDESKKLLGRKIAEWDRAQEQLRLQKQRTLEDQQRREEEEARLNAAARAESSGAKPEAVEQILTAPSVAPKPVAAATYQRSSAASVRENWCGELVNLKAVVKQAAKGNVAALAILQINQPALNAQAKIHKATLADVVPGTRGVNRGATAFRQAV